MKIKLMLFWTCILLLQATTCIAQGLELWVNGGIVPGNGGEGVVQIHVYLRNTGAEALDVPVGEIVNAGNFTEDLVLFTATAETIRGVPVKPSPKQMDIVRLEPKQITFLGTALIPAKVGQPFQRKVVYSVNPNLRVFYPIWTGQVSAVFDMSVPPREIENARESGRGPSLDK